MGERAGLTKLDRTNGFEDGRDYMHVKKSKLAAQNDQIRAAIRSRNSTLKSDIFKNVSIYVNGRTQPTADELKRLILLNGGDYHPYYRYQTTKFMIATNLSMARIKQLRPDDRVVRPEWITDSVQVKCLLPYEDYQLFEDAPRGKTKSVAGIEGPSTSNDGFLVPISETYNKSYRSSGGFNPKSSKPSASRSLSSNKTATKEENNRDIREFFCTSVKRLPDDAKLQSTSSSSSL